MFSSIIKKGVLLLMTLCSVAPVATLNSCGYRLGGLKAKNMENMSSFSVRMFENNSLEVQAGILVTNAVTDLVQRDGTYKLASPATADFRIEGTITDISFSSLQVDSENTYVSTELALNLAVEYRIIESKTNKVLFAKTSQTAASFYNEVTNIQTARDNALSYAARKMAEDLVLSICTQ